MGLLDKLSDPYMMMQIMGGLGLLTSKKQPQADKYREYMTQGLLGYSKSQKEQKQKADKLAAIKTYQETGDPSVLLGVDGLESAGATLMTQKPEKRGMFDQGGVKYWEDTLEPVLPSTAPVMDPEKLATSEDDLSKRFDTQSKDFITQTNAYSRLKESAEMGTPAGDMALIFNYMKVLDPGSTVREGEFATAQGLGGIATKLQALYNQAKDGKLLTDTQRKDMLSAATGMYTAAQDQQGGIYHRYLNIAQNRGLNPANVVTSAYNYGGLLPYGKKEKRKPVVVNGVKIPPAPWER